METKKYDGEYKIVRTYLAGVFAGKLMERTGDECVMEDARRLWHWDGAASLSQMAITGPTKPQNCKFPDAVSRVELLGVIEILDVTDEAEEIIKGVAPWRS